MKRLLLVLVIVIAGTSVLLLSSGTETRAGSSSWPPLLTCPDTTGDGTVDLPNDILGVILRFGTTYGGPPNEGGFEYALIYDTSGGNYIDLPNDVLGTILRFGDHCPLVDSQVALATQATMQYQDCQDALDDGFFQTTQMVPNMGIHLGKNSNVTNNPDFWSGSAGNTNDQIRHPAGLICTDSNPDPNIDVPDRLVGMWYVVPNMEACFVYANPPSCNDAEPEGFDGAEDNTDMNSVQKAWHTHPGLCVWAIATSQAGSGENFTEAGCDAQPTPNVWFQEYGWMSHLYNFIPNQDGRFMMWSENVPYVDP